MHTSLDGFVAGPDGELSWVTINEEIFDFVASITKQADTALYGRVTYDMMQSYWPTAADKPNASKHDKEHAVWYKHIPKVVLSKTLNSQGLENTTIISDQLSVNINKLKNEEGRNILIFGSPSASHALLSEDLIDEFWIFVNPVLLGKGMPLFKGVNDITSLSLLETKVFSSGVIALHYTKNEK